MNQNEISYLLLFIPTISYFNATKNCDFLFTRKYNTKDEFYIKHSKEKMKIELINSNAYL